MWRDSILTLCGFAFEVLSALAVTYAGGWAMIAAAHVVLFVALCAVVYFALNWLEWRYARHWWRLPDEVIERSIEREKLADDRVGIWAKIGVLRKAHGWKA